MVFVILTVQFWGSCEKDNRGNEDKSGPKLYEKGF
jgi:hypothetical protein